MVSSPAHGTLLPRELNKWEVGRIYRMLLAEDARWEESWFQHHCLSLFHITTLLDTAGLGPFSVFNDCEDLVFC